MSYWFRKWIWFYFELKYTTDISDLDKLALGIQLRLYESNLQSCFTDASFTELTRIILKGTCHMKLDKIGKFLSAILERTNVLLAETE